jgi:transcriptional antiterminator RfaH
MNEPVPAPLAWFALRSHPKHEHIAAAHLRQDADVEVFLPRIRFRRATRRGGVWFTEALFPNYLFARFNWTRDLRRVLHGRGVSGVIHFGDRWPTIPDETIAELRAQWQTEEVYVIPDALAAGDAVKIVSGPFHGLLAVVQRPLAARQRVAILLEFLGRQTCVEVEPKHLIREADPRKF